MPNWCMTDVTLVGDKKHCEKAYNALKKLEETSRKDVDTSPGSYLKEPAWLGYVVTDILKVPWQEMPCRGHFDDLRLSTLGDKHIVEFFTQSAWGPCVGVMRRLAEKFKLSLNYCAHEPAMQIHFKENPDGIYNEVIYHVFEDYESVCHDSIEEFIQECEELGSPVEIPEGLSLQEAIDYVNSNYEAHDVECIDDYSGIPIEQLE